MSVIQSESQSIVNQVRDDILLQSGKRGVDRVGAVVGDAHHLAGLGDELRDGLVVHEGLLKLWA